MSDDGPEIIVTGRSEARDPNELTLIIEGNEYRGWEDIEVALRAEAFPNSFDIRASLPPWSSIPCRDGDECVVLLGDDPVITGYVDRVIDSGDDDSHIITIQGRGRTQDLVDCSAEWESHQLIGGNAQTIATKLARPYFIGVVMVNGASPGPDVPQWAINYGETGAEIIQRLARNAALLAYEDNEGRLALASVGTASAASGIKYGENVQAWAVERSMDKRYSDYVCCGTSMDALGDLGGADFYSEAKDPNVDRHRLIYLVIENVAADAHEFTIRRANWEAARRAGRSFVVRATVDSWRDSAGGLWTPNTLVPINLPSMDAEESLVISEVVFRRSNDQGTTAELMCMRKDAFAPEPIVLAPVNLADVQ